MHARWIRRRRRVFFVYFAKKWRNFDANSARLYATASDEIQPADQLAILLYVAVLILAFELAHPNR